jgi:hypothetical protein
MFVTNFSLGDDLEETCDELESSLLLPALLFAGTTSSTSIVTRRCHQLLGHSLFDRPPDDARGLTYLANLPDNPTEPFAAAGQ